LLKIMPHGQHWQLNPNYRTNPSGSRDGGSLPIRVGRQFVTARKLGRTHQNVLVFVKGDPRKATEACGEVEFGDIDAGSEDGSTDGAGDSDFDEG
jgi:hypothetical protein